MDIQHLINAALAEDIGSGDVTTMLLVPEGLQASMQLNARQALVMAGGEVAAQVFHTLDKDVRVDMLVKDGQRMEAGATLLSLHGAARVLLTGERVALNIVQRMCGVASLTAQFVEAVAGTKVVILDTRKTMPGMRMLDKYAVVCGGGQNHRMGLYDAVMIKDNHIALCGGVKAAVEKARRELTDFPPPLRGRVREGGGVDYESGPLPLTPSLKGRGYSVNAQAFAKKLRSNLTDAEKKIWRALRQQQLGAKFRRQQPIGPYIADFFCSEHGLIVEVDGGQHAAENVDVERTQYLEGCGYRVLRFWNNEVIGNIDGVLEAIVMALRTPHPNPPPQGGREYVKIPIIVECDTLVQVEEAIAAAPDRILLDNMTPEILRHAVEMAAGKVSLEASGGVTLGNVRAVAETGVDFISIGALTHSAPAVDIGADITFTG